MSILQKLYEGGKITYMRTDSIIISDAFKTQIKDFWQVNILINLQIELINQSS